MTFKATAKDGKLDFGSETMRAKVLEWLHANEGKKITLELVKSKRSLSQNAFYWVYLGIIEIETGNSADDLHEYFKRVHLPPKFITVMGKEIKIPRSTTELSKVEMGEYLDKICAETNVPIPNPIDVGYITNYGSYPRA